MIIWFSGLIRGAIAFALSLKISGEISDHKDALVSITLIVVLMTTIILGGLMAAFAKLIGLSVESNTESHDFIARQSMHIKADGKTALERKDATWLQKKWRYIDDRFIKKVFGGDLKHGKKHPKPEQVSQESDLPEFGGKEKSNGRSTQMEKFAEIAKVKEEEKVRD